MNYILSVFLQFVHIFLRHYYIYNQKKTIVSAIFYFIFLRSKGSCVCLERTFVITDILPCSSASRKLQTQLWEKTSHSHLAPLVSTHLVIWQDKGDQCGKAFLPASLLCTLPGSLRSVLAILPLSVSLVAGKEFSIIIIPSKRHLSSLALGNCEVIFASAPQLSNIPICFGQHARRKHAFLPPMIKTVAKLPPQSRYPCQRKTC